MPFLPSVIRKMAWNQVARGSFVCSNRVPAVTDVCRPHSPPSVQNLREIARKRRARGRRNGRNFCSEVYRSIGCQQRGRLLMCVEPGLPELTTALGKACRGRCRQEVHRPAFRGCHGLAHPGTGNRKRPLGTALDKQEGPSGAGRREGFGFSPTERACQARIARVSTDGMLYHARE